MKSVPLSVAICIVRDAVDIVALACAHYLRLGFSRVHFVDDGSSDGTYEVLNAMRKACHRVTLERSSNDVFTQHRTVNAVVNHFIDRGFRVIVPFDVDEFWNLSSARLRAVARAAKPVAIQGRMINFAQDRRAYVPSLRRLLLAQRRADANPASTQADVTEFRESFLLFKDQFKVACWSSAPVQLAWGQHSFEEGPTEKHPDILDVYHLPLRSCAEITKRGLNHEPRRAPTRPNMGIAWQSRFHREVVLEGRTEAVWEANSFDENGCLNIYGRLQPLPLDLRLRTTLLRAAAYLKRHFDCDALM